MRVCKILSIVATANSKQEDLSQFMAGFPLTPDKLHLESEKMHKTVSQTFQGSHLHFSG